MGHWLASPGGYIDPSSGGMLFQILAAVFVAVSAAILFFSSQLKVLWARMRRALRSRTGHQDGE